MRPPIKDEIRYVAAEVAGFEDTIEPAMTIHGIYFAQDTSNDEAENWSFTRAFWDNDGVCTMKEPQAVTLYGGITECTLTRNSFFCVFEEYAQE